MPHARPANCQCDARLTCRACFETRYKPGIFTPTTEEERRAKRDREGLLKLFAEQRATKGE